MNPALKFCEDVRVCKLAGPKHRSQIILPILEQCFCQTTPLRESCIAIREGPQKNGKRTNVTLYKAASLTQAQCSSRKPH